jgi:hypothetical protein
MTRALFFLVIGLLISCSQPNKNTETADTLRTTEKADTIIPTETAKEEKDIATNTSSDSDEEDCIFNNDYKGLTTNWLAELNIKDFIWRNDLKKALVSIGQDTVFFSKGGCTHSGLLVELKLTDDIHPITDSTYWINKVLELSMDYKMNHYSKMIREGKIRRAHSGQKSVWYEIEDDDPEDNLIYNGIEIVHDGRNKRISISQYFN